MVRAARCRARGFAARRCRTRSQASQVLEIEGQKEQEGQKGPPPQIVPYSTARLPCLSGQFTSYHPRATASRSGRHGAAAHRRVLEHPGGVQPHLGRLHDLVVANGGVLQSSRARLFDLQGPLRGICRYREHPRQAVPPPRYLCMKLERPQADRTGTPSWVVKVRILGTVLHCRPKSRPLRAFGL